MAKSYYTILGISPDASSQEVKNAYRRLAKQYHPDHEGGDSGKFRDIQEAYSVLADSDKRRKYEQQRSGRAKVRVRVSRPEYRQYPGAEPLIPDREPMQEQMYERRRGPGRVPFMPEVPESEDIEDLFARILRKFL
ncbi:MAG: J domain-containing protein [Desulfobacterales bacterium]|nr:J domain-containing protein [Desulfobacterales bacterium]